MLSVEPSESLDPMTWASAQPAALLSSSSIMETILVQFFTYKEQNPFKASKNKTLCVHPCVGMCTHAHTEWEDDTIDNFSHTRLPAQRGFKSAGAESLWELSLH